MTELGKSHYFMSIVDTFREGETAGTESSLKTSSKIHKSD